MNTPGKRHDCNIQHERISHTDICNQEAVKEIITVCIKNWEWHLSETVREDRFYTLNILIKVGSNSYQLCFG